CARLRGPELERTLDRARRAACHRLASRGPLGVLEVAKGGNAMTYGRHRQLNVSNGGSPNEQHAHVFRGNRRTPGPLERRAPVESKLPLGGSLPTHAPRRSER